MKLNTGCFGKDDKEYRPLPSTSAASEPPCVRQNPASAANVDTASKASFSLDLIVNQKSANVDDVVRTADTEDHSDAC